LAEREEKNARGRELGGERLPPFFKYLWGEPKAKRTGGAAMSPKNPPKFGKNHPFFGKNSSKSGKNPSKSLYLCAAYALAER
jgi:hypothetical protein